MKNKENFDKNFYFELYSTNLEEMNNKEEFKSFFEILPNELKVKLKSKLKEKEIIDFLKSLLEGNIKEHIKPIYINKGIIYVAVDNPIWGQEFLFYKDRFLKRINSKFKSDFYDIKYRFLPQYFQRDDKRSSFDKLNDELKKEVEDEIKIVDDAQMKEKLKNLIASIILSDKSLKK
ncbi:MAG: DUF721 domain-containing protein [Spirochaetes bacterium]|nr:DUF721 domain-containing protein [Spirochaetota bacterium]